MLIALLIQTGAALSMVSAAAARAPGSAPAACSPQAGPCRVAVLRADWTDAARDRRIPARIYYPVEGRGPFPIIIFSHGLGGSCEGYEYIGRHWASYGYVSIHVQHEGSDTAVWRGQANPAEQMARAAKDPRNVINRPKDVSFTIDQVIAMQAGEGPLKGRLAIDRVAVAGHSFGAFTSLAVAGEAPSREAVGPSMADPRVIAAIPMSAPVPTFRKDYDTVYGQIRIPCLHLTGTLDESPIGETTAAERRIPYDHITRADQYLVTFIGGDHMVFSGRPRRGRGGEKDVLFQDLVRVSTTVFLEAYLKGDPGARAWLQGPGFAAALGGDARLERKQGDGGATRPAASDPPARENGRERLIRRPGRLIPRAR